MNFLQKAVQAAKQAATAPEVSVIDFLRKNLSEPKPPRDPTVIHASDLTKPFFCARKIRLIEQLGILLSAKHVDPGLQATFDIGNMTSDLLREKWLGDRAIGDWQCTRCLETFAMCRKPSTVGCSSKAGFHIWKYGETCWNSEPLGFEGSLDVILDVGQPKWMIAECKIMAVDQFDKITAPLAEHRIRTNLYMKMVDSILPGGGKLNVERAKIIYVSRGYGKKHEPSGQILPFKEYDVLRNDDDLKEPLARAAIIKECRSSGILGPRACEYSYQPEAKTCPVVSECFSGKYL